MQALKAKLVYHSTQINHNCLGIALLGIGLV